MNVLFVPERIEEDPLFEHTFISEVECAMLWPDDELRERKQKEALPHVYKRLSDLGISFPVDVEREALDVALGSDSDKARAEEAMNSYRRGMLVGATLRDIVARFKIDGTRKTLGNSISPHTTGHGLVMSEETFLNNIWPKFRQVSHLWAAHLFLNEKLTKSDGNQEIFFPYSIEHRKLFMLTPTGI